MVRSEEAMKCDSCGRDFCKADLNFYSHCLSLRDKTVLPQTVAVLDILMSPLLDREYLFCGEGCLIKWLQNRADARNEEEGLRDEEDDFVQGGCSHDLGEMRRLQNELNARTSEMLDKSAEPPHDEP